MELERLESCEGCYEDNPEINYDYSIGLYSCNTCGTLYRRKAVGQDGQEIIWFEAVERFNRLERGQDEHNRLLTSHNERICTLEDQEHLPQYVKPPRRQRKMAKKNYVEADIITTNQEILNNLRIQKILRIITLIIALPAFFIAMRTMLEYEDLASARRWFNNIGFIGGNAYSQSSVDYNVVETQSAQGFDSVSIIGNGINIRIASSIGSNSEVLLITSQLPSHDEFRVRTTTNTNIRSGPGTNYPIVAESPAPAGVYTIIEETSGQGSITPLIQWGRLKSGAGWISLANAERLD